jgi:hypothetical protein
MATLAIVQIDDYFEAGKRLEKSLEWSALTNPQKVFVVVFVATGSALEATKAGYKTKSEANARVMSYELAKNKSIMAALDVARGIERSEKDLLVAEVRSQLRAAERGSIAASRLAAQLERLTVGATRAMAVEPNDDDVEQPQENDSQPDPEPPETDSNDLIEAPANDRRYKVGELFLQNGCYFRAKSVDADGHILAADEVK